MNTTEQGRVLVNKVWNEPLARLAIVLSPFMAAGIAEQEIGLRDVLPEPIDVFDHVGNAMPSAMLGYSAAYGVVVATKQFGSERVRERTRQLAIGAGFCVGVVVNAVVETRTGGVVVDLPNTPDALDAAYGIISATVAATLVPITSKNPHR